MSGRREREDGPREWEREGWRARGSRGGGEREGKSE